MQYYINTIEQILNEDKKSYSEYGATEKVANDATALSKYYTKLANVAADIGKNHTYMHIQIVNSDGFTIKSEKVGTYIDDNGGKES